MYAIDTIIGSKVRLNEVTECDKNKKCLINCLFEKVADAYCDTKSFKLLNYSAEATQSGEKLPDIGSIIHFSSYSTFKY